MAQYDQLINQCVDGCRDDDDDKSDNSDENDTFALTSRQKDMQRRRMQESILAAAEGSVVLFTGTELIVL